MNFLKNKYNTINYKKQNTSHDFKPFNMLKFFDKNLFFAVIIIKCSEVAMFFKKKYFIGLYLKENNQASY